MNAREDERRKNNEEFYYEACRIDIMPRANGGYQSRMAGGIFSCVGCRTPRTALAWARTHERILVFSAEWRVAYAAAGLAAQGVVWEQ